MTTRARVKPVKGQTSQNRDAWLAERDGGITATEIAKLAQGRATDKRDIIGMKLGTIAHPDLTGNRYVDRGNEREDPIADWVEANFDIAPNRHAYVSGSDARDIATPDGISHMFEVDGVLCEIKTSKHDLDPLKRMAVDPQTGGVVKWDMRRFATHFWSTGYFDQMQWQMHVMDASKVLFVWEQHDDNWPNPKPVHAEPRWVWVLRDQGRIDELAIIARKTMQEIEEKRLQLAIEATTKTESPTSDVDVASESDTTEIDDEIRQLSAALLAAREAEAAAAAAKKKAWDALQSKVAERPDFTAKDGDVQITWSTTEKPVDVLDDEKMRTKSPRLVEQFEALKQRYTRREFQTTRKLTVTKAKSKA